MIVVQRIRRGVLTLLLSVLFSPFVSCQKPPEPAAGRSPNERPAAPSFALKRLSGGTVSLAQLKGKPVFLDFWATWCGPCRMSIPAVQNLHDTYGDRLQVVGINLDDSPSSVAPFVKGMKITYTILLGGGSGVDAQYGVSGIPAFLLLDEEGRAVDGWQGFHPSYKDLWSKAVDQVLSEK